jgi:hypothetical protein
MKNIIAKSLLNSYTYAEYRKIIGDLLAEGKASGDLQSEDLVHYSILNETRMNRLEKTVVVLDEVAEKLKSLKKNYIWLVISESWCGDAAQLLPVFNKMALVGDKIKIKIVFRDENPELMGMFLTNGAKSIAKLIILDQSTQEFIADFGPRPKGASDLLKNYRKKFGIIDETIKTELQLWYLHDKGFSTQKEIAALMEK